MLARIAVVVVSFSAASCGGEPPRAAPPSVPSAGGAPVERYFPLEEGRLYAYATTENGETGMLVAKVHRSDASHGELRLSNATKRFVFAPDGVAYDGGGAYLLKTPLDAGASWPGEHGGSTRITSLDASVTVPAGTYASCLETTEEGGRPQGSKYVTTYCPGVGMVLLLIQVPGGEAKAELKSYGMPVKID